MFLNESDVNEMLNVSLHMNETVVHTLKVYGNTILRLSYSYLHNLSDAEDVLQDTLISLMKNKPVFSNMEHEKAWLMRVAINLSKNKLKSSWFKTVGIPEDFQAEGITEGESEVLEAVHNLPIKYREVIHLFIMRVIPHLKFHVFLRRRKATIRSLLHRSRKMLKKALKGVYDFDE